MQYKSGFCIHSHLQRTISTFFLF